MALLRERQKKEFLLKLVNTNLFYSHILLRKSDDKKLVTSDEKQQLKEYFFSLLQQEKEYLPADFCLQVFFQYLMYKEALLFMFYRGEYDKLLKLIHDQYFEEKQAIGKLRNKLDGTKLGAPTGKVRTEEQKQIIQNEIDSRLNLQSFWVTSLQKYAQKINSNFEGSQQAAEKFIWEQIRWTVDEIGVDCTIECLKKSKLYEPPFRSDDLLKRYLKIPTVGSSAVISYLEYMCLECGPTRADLVENARLFKIKEEQKKGIEPVKPSLRDIMLRQQEAIYQVPSRAGGLREITGKLSELLSQEEIELWESCHTELGCWYVETT